MLQFDYHKGRGDVFTITPMRGKARVVRRKYTPAEITDIDKMALCYRGSWYDSDTDPALFDWLTGATDGEIAISFDAISDSLQPGAGTVLVVIYDSENTAGVVIGKFRLRIFTSLIFLRIDDSKILDDDDIWEEYL